MKKIKTKITTEDGLIIDLMTAHPYWFMMFKINEIDSLGYGGSIYITEGVYVFPDGRRMDDQDGDGIPYGPGDDETWDPINPAERLSEIKNLSFNLIV